MLQWNPVDFGGIEYVALFPTQVWLPDFGISNRYVYSWEES